MVASRNKDHAGNDKNGGDGALNVLKRKGCRWDDAYLWRENACGGSLVVESEKQGPGSWQPVFCR